MIYVPSRMGQLNRRALLHQLQKLGLASRADLAKALGMSQPTAGKIVDELIAMDVVEEVAGATERGDSGDAGNQLGRPGRQLRLNQSRAKFLAIHLGVKVTTLAGLPLGVTGEDSWPVAFELPPRTPDSARVWLNRLRSAARSFSGENFQGVLVSAPGVVDEAANRILYSPNNHWTDKADVVALIRRVWDVPVLLVQEVRALALGHHQTHPGCDDFLLVDFSEGVGGAVIVAGRPLANPLPISGEIGHTPVPGNLRPCGCGAIGCMETLISPGGLLESFSAAAPGRENTWPALCQYLSQNGVKPWLAQALDPVAAAIAGALNVLGLRRVVITGSLTELPPVVMQYVSHAVQNGAMWARFGRVECLSATRRRAAGLVAVGIDRLVVPDREDKNPAPSAKLPARSVRLPAISAL